MLGWLTNQLAEIRAYVEAVPADTPELSVVDETLGGQWHEWNDEDEAIAALLLRIIQPRVNPPDALRAYASALFAARAEDLLE